MTSPTDRPADPFLRALLVLGGITLGLHVAGVVWLRDQLWGTHLYAFLPAPLMVAMVAALLGVAASALTGRAPAAPARVEPRRGGGTPAGRGARPPASPAAPAAGKVRAARLRALGIGLGGAALFWLVRIHHRILGDANSLSQNLAKGESFHPDSPLTEVVHHLIYLATRGLFGAGTARPPADIAFDTVALGSVLCGGAFALVAWALTGELLGATGGAESPRGLAAAPKLRWLLFGCLLAQGYVLLFCGYVENYTYRALLIGCYLLFALRHLAGRGALVWPGVFLILAVAFDLSAAVLGPSFVVLVALGTWRPGRRLAAARDLAILAAVFAGAALLLWKLGDGYNLVSHVLQMGRTAQSGELQEGSAGLFSLAHLRDFLSEQMLIGPLALLLAAAALVHALRARRMGEPRIVFLLSAAGVCALASFLVRDLRLGYPRDWDLFAPFGITYAVFGFHVYASGARAARPLRRSLALALAVSLFHTVPWVAVNTSFDRAFERLKTLPCGLGRTEAMVGYWSGVRGDLAGAHTWLKRATDVNKNNVGAYLIDGTFYVQEGRFMEGARRIWFATRLRPSWMEYRVWLVDALLRGGEPAGAAQEAEVLIEKWPTSAQALAVYGVALQGAGRVDEARAALGGALAIAPADSAYREAIANLGVDGGYERTMKTVWGRIAKVGE